MQEFTAITTISSMRQIIIFLDTFSTPFCSPWPQT